jgi:TatD DNase family protein
MLIDSHCHLDLVKHTTPEILVTEAQRQGVSHCLCVAVDLPRLPNMLSIAQRLDNVFASVGVHPNSTEAQEPNSETLCTLADDSVVLAIGETGLDYYRSQGDLTWQQTRFRTHIRAARQIGKPLIIHNREATADTLRILEEENAAEIGGIMHCFVEDWETAQRAMAMGFYISFSGVVTFKNARELQSVAKKVPLNKILIETDAPFLAPVPYRGKTNQPAYVRYVAQCIAELREESFETIAQATTENFFNLFNIANPHSVLH